VQRSTGLQQLVIALPAPLAEGLVVGASVGVDGVCLTVTGLQARQVSFDVMAQTLSLTTLGELAAGDAVNVERSASQGAEIGGHLISGHIDGCAEIIAIHTPANNRVLRLRPPPALMKYLLNQGFVGLNGCSLTLAAVDREQGWFEVHLIPETLRITTFAAKRVGDRINLEVDRQTQAIVDTVERVLRDNPGLLLNR
jgi:riboflavin synthase